MVILCSQSWILGMGTSVLEYLKKRSNMKYKFNGIFYFRSLKNCSRSLDTWSSIVKNFWHQIRVIGNKYKQKLFDLFKDKKAKAK